MPIRQLTLLLFLLMTFAFVSIAQDAPAPERQLTATQLIINATESAQPNQTQVSQTPTDEAFVQTATALVVHATQTSQANGGLVPTQATRIDAFALTATQVMMDMTATAQSGFVAQTEIETPEPDPMSPLTLTFIMVILLIGVLVVISGAFSYMNSRQTPKN